MEDRKTLKAADLKALNDSDFAYVDSSGGRHLPIADEAHVRAALARFNQTNFESPDAKAKAAKKIVAAAKRFNITVDPSSAVGNAAGLRSRWSGEQRRERARGGVERRAEYRGKPESRSFSVARASGVQIRQATTSTPGQITLTGSPLRYSPVSYQVTDSMGTFTESISPGALASILPTSDTRFLVNHEGLALARTASGTLQLHDTSQALEFTAQLDPRQTLASDLAIAIQRGDCSQMSIGMIVAEDSWADDWSSRTIRSLDSLLDISAVTFPASPTTSIAMVDDRAADVADDSPCNCTCALCATDNPEQHCPNCDAGDTGDKMGNDPSPASAADGTGSRSRLRRSVLELSLPPRRRLPTRSK